MERDYEDGIFPGLPFFLQDIRPQGFLGRAIARETASRVGVPADPRLWNDDDILAYLVQEGRDQPGDLVVGDRAAEMALRATEIPSNTAIQEADRLRVYPGLALSAQRGDQVGSSAGGEQPKFITTLQRATGDFQSVLVKFSASGPSDVSQRWADLLRCEHLASLTLRARQIKSSVTEILTENGQVFLEVERFDRVGAFGRRGLVSLGSIEDAFMESSSSDWVSSAGMLVDSNWIDTEDSRRLRWLWCFGDLIANSDMHRANASLWFTDELPFRMTPSYDMLPMLYSPGAQGDLSERIFTPQPPLSRVNDVWADAAAAALEFWDRITNDAAISDSFRKIASLNSALIQRMIKRFG